MALRTLSTAALHAQTGCGGDEVRLVRVENGRRVERPGKKHHHEDRQPPDVVALRTRDSDRPTPRHAVRQSAVLASWS